jgi:hypothetical protein
MTLNKNILQQTPLGIYHDVICSENGSTKDFGWRNNLIVDRCRILLSAFMFGDSNSTGIQFLSLGRGLESWDDNGPGSPVPEDVTLVDSSPVNINLTDAELTITYLDVTNTPTATPSQRLQLELDLPAGFLPLAPGEDTFPLREFALFGRYNTDDFMID